MILLFLIIAPKFSICQFVPPCILPGFTPSTAILICGNQSYIQEPVSPCQSSIAIPKFCTVNRERDTSYKTYSSVYYKFKCYKTGTLGFVITPNDMSEDLDWQLFDITGKDPEMEIFFSASLTITGYWLDKKGGHKGAIGNGPTLFTCSPSPPTNYPPDLPRYATMPTLIEGHDYLLMVARSENTVGGFRLDFIGGTTDITDPLKPHMVSAIPECNGEKITIKLNKKIVCESLSPDGSQFRFLPAGGPRVINATLPEECKAGNVFDEVTLTLATPLTAGNYNIDIIKGSDRKILRDVCANHFPANESVSFDFTIPTPIMADSVGNGDCMPDSIRLYYPKKINCNSISANGSDFAVSGPQAVSIKSATGNCKNGKTEYVIIKFDQPITTKGNYQLTIKAGDDGTVLVDECGEQSPEQTLPFNIADSVNADFIYSTKFGCQRDTLSFSHDAAHDVNNWKWIFNKNIVTTPSHTIIWPAKSSNEVKLYVTNSSCTDSSVTNIELDNEVKTAFNITDMLCPEDKLEVKNETIGNVDRWKWSYDIIGNSTSKDPLPFQFPTLNKQAYYSVKLVAYNDTYNCSDSSRKTLTVLDHCNIGVATAFTPNNDGLNDTFWPHNALKADNLEFKVFNRWGQLVFQSRTWRDKWDGTMNGQQQPTGVYVWMLSYINRDTKKQVFQKGTVMLIR